MRQRRKPRSFYSPASNAGHAVAASSRLLRLAEPGGGVGEQVCGARPHQAGKYNVRRQYVEGRPRPACNEVVMSVCKGWEGRVASGVSAWSCRRALRKRCTPWQR